MNSIDNASILRDAQAAWNAKDIEKCLSYSRPDARMKTVTGQSLTFREYIENWAKAFPDGKITDVHMVQQGDTVVAEFVGRGTHTGPLHGPMGTIQPTQRRMELKLVEIYEFSNGKIVSGRVYFDTASMMTQLGMMPQVGPQTSTEARARS